jgi:hypothetical protein
LLSTRRSDAAFGLLLAVASGLADANAAHAQPATESVLISAAALRALIEADVKTVK